MDKTFTCGACKRTLPVSTSGGTGYAGVFDKPYCYDCIAKMDAIFMKENGRITLYLNSNTPELTRPVVINWPGTLRFVTTENAFSDHNIAGKDGRRDVWFIGPDGAEWHGVNIGDNQLVRCKRLKKQKKDLVPLEESVYLKPYPYPPSLEDLERARAIVEGETAP